MDTVTASLKVTREISESLLAALVERRAMCQAFPQLFGDGEDDRIRAAEAVIYDALHRISYMETRPAAAVRPLRERLAARLATPRVRAW